MLIQAIFHEELSLELLFVVIIIIIIFFFWKTARISVQGKEGVLILRVNV